MNKKLLGLLTASSTLLVACGSHNRVADFNIEFNAPFTTSLGDDLEINIDIDSNSELKATYDQMGDIFGHLTTVEQWNDIAVLTTTTANLLHEAGITPSGISNSNDLNDELKAMRCDSTTVDTNGDIDMTGCASGETIASIGSVLAASSEVVTALDPELFLIADGFPSETPTFGDIPVEVLPQTDFMDPFALIQYISDNAPSTEIEDASQLVIDRVVSEMEELGNLITPFIGTTAKRTAIIQVTGDAYNILNQDTSAGQLANMIGLNNLFGHLDTSLAISVESLVDANPEYIVIMGAGPDAEQAMIRLEDQLKDDKEAYRAISAVKNNNVFVTDLAASMDFTSMQSAITLQKLIFN